MSRPSTARLLAAAALAAAGAACAPTTVSHGYAPHPDDVAEIRPGVDTRGSVERRFGPPAVAGIAEPGHWFYVASRFERFAFYQPELVDRTVVAVEFDDVGVVREVRSLGVEDGRVIDLVTRTTPTFGRELTAIQQLFGNIGRFEGGQDGTLIGQRR